MNQPDPTETTETARALAFLEGAAALEAQTCTCGCRKGADLLRHMADQADPMVGSLARDGFGLDEIAVMQTPAAPVVPPAPTSRTAIRSTAFDDALQDAGHALMTDTPATTLVRVLTNFRDEHRAEVLREAADAVAALVADGEHDPDCLVDELRRLAAEEQGVEGKRPLFLSTPCAVCTHPYNWHKAGICRVEDCGCIAFAIEPDARAAAEEQPESETPDTPPREPHPTEVDQRHALTLLARVQGRDVAGPAVAPQPEEADRIVAHVLAAHTAALHCLVCAPPPWGDIWTPVTAGELEDGGICSRCGVDVLIPPPAKEQP